jgi:hypothetical protein
VYEQKECVCVQRAVYGSGFVPKHLRGGVCITGQLANDANAFQTLLYSMQTGETCLQVCMGAEDNVCRVYLVRRDICICAEPGGSIVGARYCVCKKRTPILQIQTHRRTACGYCSLWCAQVCQIPMCPYVTNVCINRVIDSRNRIWIQCLKISLGVYVCTSFTG